MPSELPDELVFSIRSHLETLSYERVDIKSDVKDTRNSSLSWIGWNNWISGVIHNMMMFANAVHFKYDLHYFESNIQSTVYTSEFNDNYSWHVDNSLSTYPSGDHERKLSCSLILSDPDEYEGGQFQLHYHKNWSKIIKPPKGTAVIFPSWLPHRVRPVTSGKRISLVAWMQGPMFK